MSSTSELKTLRQKLSEIDPIDWPKVDTWVALATPLIRTRLPDHLDDFRKVCATPQWSFSPLFSTGGDPWSGVPPTNNFAEAAASDKASNQRRAEDAKAKILAFLEGLIGLSAVTEVGAGSSIAETRMPSTLRIFISHAGGDAKLAQALIDLIEAGLEVPTGSIRCTSVSGYKLEGGDDTPEVLRENLKVCPVVLRMLTKTSIASSYVLMELGAAWAFKKRAIPLLAADVGFDNLGPFKDIHALKMDHDADMSGLVKTLGRETGLAETNNMPKIVTALKALRVVLGSATPASEVSTRPPFDPESVSGPPAAVDDDEAIVHLEVWLEQLVDSVHGGTGTTPMILGAADIASQARVPEAKAPLVVRAAVENEHFGAKVTQLQSGKFRLDIGARKIRRVRNQSGW
jgi:hypothetical protein